MEAGGYRLTRGTCFVVSRLEVAVVAGLLWISWFVRGGADLSCVFFFFKDTRPAASMRSPCLIHLSTSDEARLRERRNRGRFLPIGRKPSPYRAAYRVPISN